MKKLILATHNKYKAEEFKQILPQFRVQTLADLNYDQEIAETASDLERNLTVNGNLVVQGTASFQHADNLDVADRFIRLASGSTAVGDGGIVVQQDGPANGEAFAYDAAKLRWSVTGSFNPATESYTPDAFMATVLEGAASDPTATVAKYTKKGNIFVANNQDIYIYS